MEINYELTPQHLIDFQKITDKNDSNNTSLGRIIGLSLVFLVFVDFIYCLASGSIPSNLISIFVHLFIRLILIALMLLGMSVFLQYLHRRVINKLVESSSKNGLFCEHKIILDEEELIEITDVNFARYSWVGIGEITENEKFVLIPINMSSSFTIPKESFQNQNHLKEFMETANEYRQNAQLRFNSSYFAKYELES